MAYTFNTGNPVGPNGSADARDLVDNAQVADRLINGSELTVPDRLGVQRRTWNGIQQSVVNYVNRGEWVTATAYQINDIWRDGPTGAFYLVLADYTSGASAAADITGGNVVVHQPKDWVVSVATIADLRLLEPAFGGQQFYAGGTDGGPFQHDPADTTSPDDGERVFVTSAGARIKRKDVSQYAKIGNLPVDQLLALLNSAANTDNSDISQRKIRIIAGSIRQESSHVVSGVSVSLPNHTMTVTDSGHRYQVGDWVYISGANESEYNSIFQVSVASAGGYDLTLGFTPTRSCTGTISAKCPGLWDWIKDSTHEPVGVDSSQPVRAAAGGFGLRVPMDKTYYKVGAVIAGPDEQLSAAYCMSLGCSVALNAFEIRGGLSRTIAARVYWDGTQWLKTEGNEQKGITGYDYINGNLTIKHKFCPDYDVQLSPNNASGTIAAPYVPIVKNPTAKQCIVNFLDTLAATEAASLVSTTNPTTRMALSFSKNYKGIFKFDGTDGSFDLNFQFGNIWFIGFMYE